LEREPNAGEIAEKLNITPDGVSDALKISVKELSLDAPFNQLVDSRLLDILPDTEQMLPDNNLVDRSLQIEIGRILNKLTEREAEVLKLYYGLEDKRPHNLEEISQRFQLTRERIRQIKEKAIRKIRHAARDTMLNEYLG